MHARVVECRPNRYCLLNSCGWIWGTQSGPFGCWWDRPQKLGKVWWTRSKAVKQLALLKAADKLK